MPDSQNPEHVRKLIREFQLKGANLIPTLTGEIVPTVLVADLTEDTSGIDRLAHGGRIGSLAGAANQSMVVLVNPPGSGILVTLEKWWAWSSAAGLDFVQFQVVLASGITGNATAWRDTQLLGEPVAQITRTTQVTAVLGVPQIPIDDGAIFPPVVMKGRWVLAPADSFVVIQNVANLALHAMFMWRERDLVTGV